MMWQIEAVLNKLSFHSVVPLPLGKEKCGPCYRGGLGKEVQARRKVITN